MNIGDIAPDFTLKDHHNKEFTLSDHKGKKVLLSWHPLAWTKVCAQQMQSLEAHKQTFEELNTVAVGLSVDTIPCKHAWAKELNIWNIPLLSDFWPHGKVADMYGVLRDEGFSERANIIIDEEGKTIFFKIYDVQQLPDINEIITFLKK
ncbi:MAG TPA: redoxin domain-containing protein [Candidatus Cloacimonetes bacterium]|nr:redoxin domain-containing protein [Candidatus Cloacimonadota bacterium]HEX38204.1 redoxin domain-containing protein [Candidatus Cloacimonadota bacterium]